MPLPRTQRKTKLPRTLNRCQQKKERKQGTSYSIDDIIEARKKLRTQGYTIYIYMYVCISQ